MIHWLEDSGKLRLLWISSDKTSFSEELFEGLVGLGSGYTVECWRCNQSDSSEAIMNKRGAWAGFEGHVAPAQFKLSATYDSHVAKPPRMVRAVLGAGTLAAPMSANASDLFEDHRARGEWSFGMFVHEASDSADVLSLLAFSAWLDSKLSSGRAGSAGEVVERMVLSMGSAGFVVLPTCDVDMRRGVVCVGGASLINELAGRLPADSLGTKAQADMRGWRAVFGL